MAQEAYGGREWIRLQPILEARIAELQQLIAELQQLIGRRDGLAVEPQADQLDELQQASRRNLDGSHIDRQSQQLRETRAALRRVAEGVFGVCEQCGENTHSNRLAAIPWTALCIGCQEEVDRDRQEQGLSIFNLLEDPE